MTPLAPDPGSIPQHRAGRYAGAAQSAASLFWPSRPEHVVKSVVLALPRQRFSRATLRMMQEATVLAAAIRSGEDSKLLSDGWLDMLKARSARLLEQIAESLACPDSATNLVLRAQVLRGRPLASVADEIGMLDEKALFGLCGGLGTWHGKSRAIYHSTLFAEIDQDAEALIARVDSLRADTETYLRTLVSPRLTVTAAPRMKITRLFLCGGEANFYPKHFAYFLPEDEDVKHAHNKKTVVFGNVYQALYRHVTEPFAGQRVVLSAPTQMSDDAVYKRLVLWIRGHDTGHQVRLPETDYKVLRAQGRWLSMVLQECLADVFGFLMSTGGPWSTAVPHRLRDPALAGHVFLREMLRYLCRGGDDFPDAGAALIELSFLVRNGYIDADPSAPVLSTTVKRLHDGMRALGVALTETALANDERGAGRFIDTYYRHGLRDLAMRFGTCAAVLDYIQDLGNRAPSNGGEPLAPARSSRARITERRTLPNPA